MQTFYDACDAQLDATAGGDRQLTPTDAILFDFASGPVRIWAGEGEMITPDGESWHGFMVTDADENRQSLFHAPALQDIRSGTSPLYDLSLHHLDEETYLACRDMAATEVKGRFVTFYSVLMPKRGTRALTPPGDGRRLEMLDTRWSEKRSRGEDGELLVQRTITVIAKTLNQGRSLTHFGIMSDTVQRARSKQIHGIDDDHYCQFTGKYAGGYTIQIF